MSMHEPLFLSAQQFSVSNLDFSKSYICLTPLNIPPPPPCPNCDVCESSDRPPNPSPSYRIYKSGEKESETLNKAVFVV